MNPFYHAILTDFEQVLPGQMVSLLSDHSYSWWSHPSNVYHNGVNYFTSVSINGDQYIHKFEDGGIQSAVVNSGLVTDEHNRPSFLIRENDIIVVIHTRNSVSFFCRAISFDLQTLGSLVNIGSQAGFIQANYSQVFDFNGRIIVLCREEMRSWAVTWSDDNGTTWTSKKILIEKDAATEPDYLYLSCQKNENKLIITAVYHPTTGDTNRLFLIELNGITGDITEGGTNLGNLYDSGFTTINTNTLFPVFTPIVGMKLRLLDVSVSQNDVNILLSYFPNTTNGNYIFKKISRSDLSSLQEIEIIDHGYDTYTTYFGGAYFVKNENSEWNNTIYLARNENDIWTVEEWKYNGLFSKVQEIDSLTSGLEGLSLTRPEPPINSEAGGLKIIYQKGDYDGTFTTWNNEIIGIE